MQNKKTIIIFNNKTNQEISFALKEYLLEDKSVLPIIIAEQELNPAIMNIADDKILGEDSPALALFGVYHKLAGGVGLDSVPKKSPEYNNDRNSHTKMKNIFKRYTPDVVVCMSARCLRAAIAVKKFLKSDTRIAVYLSEFIVDKSYIYPEVNVYFTASAAIKSGLIRAGIDTDKIIVTPMLSRKRYLNKIDKDVAKTEFGLPKGSPVVLIMANGHLNRRFSELVEKLAAADTGYSYLVYCGYDRALLKDMLKLTAGGLVARNEGIDMNLAFSAADIVVMRPRGETVGVALAKECLMVTYCADGEREHRASGNLATDLAVNCTNPEEVADVMSAYAAHPEVYRKQIELMRISPKEAGERMKDYLIAMI